jgi:hypothetical protein
VRVRLAARHRCLRCLLWVGSDRGSEGFLARGED